ncbi:histidinol dehydrogenase [Helicobacter pylori]|nr:histidinol dehydrogenase [Helicobacter pylori]
MRLVVFDASGILEAFDYGGVLIHKQEVRANEKVKLPFTEKNLFKFNGVSFGVCEGVGDLDYRDYPKNLNFNVLLVETIENYLSNAKEPLNEQQKVLLEDFLEVYEKNITKGVYYLKPKFFAEKENQLIETTTKLLTSYQIFLNQARENATNQITENKTQSLEAITQAKTNANNEITDNKTQAITNINEAKTSANNEINTNKQEVLNNITQEKQEATSEITEAKKTAFNELLETLKPKFSGLFVGAYYIRNVIYIQGGWEQKIKDLSDYALEKSKKGE